MKSERYFQCLIFILLALNASSEYVPWMDVFKEVVNNGIIFPPKLPPCNPQNCINGRCMLLNECECFDGFEGIKCDRRILFFSTSPPPSPTPFPITSISSINPNVEEVDTVTSPKTTVSTTPDYSITQSVEEDIPKVTTGSPFDISTTTLPSETDFSTKFIPVIPKTTATVITKSPILTSTSSSTLISNNDPTTVIPTTPAFQIPDKTSETTISSPTLPFKVSPSTTTVTPKCPYLIYCNKVAANGFCDLRCNIKECNFDSGDCIEKDSTDKPSDINSDKCPESCSYQLKNGICNDECKIKKCIFDETVCQKLADPLPTQKDQEKVKLQIVYEINPANFDKTKATKFLDKFSQLSNIPNIRYSTTDSGDFEIYKWTKDAGKGDLIKLESFAMLKPSNLEGVEVNFDVDFGQCKMPETKCRFQNAKEVESYLNTAPVYEVTSELGAPIYEARVIFSEKESNGIGYILGIMVTVLVVIVGAFGVLENQTRKRKIISVYPQDQDPSYDFNKRQRYETEMTYHELYRMMRMKKTSEIELFEILQTINSNQRTLDWKTERGETLLHWAIRLNHFQIASWLLERTEDINAADNGGNTYLSDSIKNTKAGFLIFQRLLQHPEIEVNTIFGANMTPLKQSAESDALLPFLKLLCAHPKINIRLTGFIRDRKCMRQNVLHHAAGRGCLETIKFLIDLKPTNVRKSETSLIAVLDDNGRTPLVFAIESEQWEAAKLLIQHMKTVDLEAGINALTVAKHFGNDEICRLIEAKTPKKNPSPPQPPKKKEQVKTSVLDFMKPPTESYPILPPTATMIPQPSNNNNIGYSNPQYYPYPIINQQHQPSPMIPQQHLSPMQAQQQQLPHQLQQYTETQLPITSQISPTVAQNPQQVQYTKPQLLPAPIQRQPPATVSQYLQDVHSYPVTRIQTPPTKSKSKPKLSRMQSQPIIRQIQAQPQQHQQLQYANQYGSMQSIPSSSSTGHYVQPQPSITQSSQHQQQQQWQNQQNTVQYSQQFVDDPYYFQQSSSSNYPEYSQFQAPPVPVQRQKQLKRAQSFAVLSTSQTSQFYQEIPAQHLQYYYPSNNDITNYSNYPQQQPSMPVSIHPQQHPQQYLDQYHQPESQLQQQHQQIASTSYYHPQPQQQPQTSTPIHEQQQPQYSMMPDSYQTLAGPSTFMPPNLSPITYDTSGYQTGSPDSFLNFTNESFQNNFAQ